MVVLVVLAVVLVVLVLVLVVLGVVLEQVEAVAKPLLLPVLKKLIIYFELYPHPEKERHVYFSTTVFKTVVKNVLDRQTLIFTVAIFLPHQKQYTFSKSSNENRRFFGGLAAPVAANSGKKTCAFSYCKFKQS